MKIAFIGQKGIPARSGGVEKHVEEVAVRMAQLGHEVFVYVRDNYTEKKLQEYKGVKLIHLPSIRTKHLDAISHTLLASLHAIFTRYDVVHFHAIGPSSLSWIIKFFKPRTALVATFHCQDYYHQKWGWFAQKYLRFGEWMTCRVPDQTIVVSKALGVYVEAAYKRAAVVIPNGAEVEYTKAINEISQQWNLREKKYILSVGRLIKHKGVHYLIEAFKQLEDTSKLPNNFKLVIVGDGFYTDDYVDYLHEISRGRENIIFTGEQHGETLNQLFSKAYMFVQPSESEGLSITLLEAMGHGLCMLTSDIPENKEPLGEAGHTFESKNVTDLRDKMAFLLNRPEEAKRLGELAKKRIQMEYGWDSIAQKTVDVYQNLVSLKK